MLNLRPFEIVLIAIFAAIALFSIGFFAFYQGSSVNEEGIYGNSLSVWGTLDAPAFREVIASIGDADDAFDVVRYTQFDERTFDEELTNAIAEGRSPDLVVLPHDSLITHRAKLVGLSFETIPERTFRDTYVDGAEIFLLADGVYGVPFAVDPLVMYWNRDTFSSNGLANPPSTWEVLVSSVVPSITRITPSLDILESAIAFGEFSNVTNAKSILSMLIIQAGSNIIEENRDSYAVTLNESQSGALPAGEAALSFYTQFANPANVNYSWNRALPNDRFQFLGSELAQYFGFGSELSGMRNSNPNLNFDISVVPQGANATTRRTYGTFYAFVIPRASGNTQGAYLAAQQLASAENAAYLTELLGLAPVHRGELGKGTGNPERSIIFESALIARGWLDPDPVASENTFKTMVEDVTSGRARISEAIRDAVGRLRLEF